MKELETLGARVHVIAADVSVEADVRRLMRAIRRMPPLRGVIHCAGVLEDGILEQMEWPRFTAVTAPKIKGAWLLHTYTRAWALDHFVVQSSLLSLTGSAWQANYTAANAFLDALVALRTRSGQPALGINWGPWSEAGMAASRGARGAAMWQSRGVRLLAPADGLHAFSRLYSPALPGRPRWPTSTGRRFSGTLDDPCPSMPWFSPMRPPVACFVAAWRVRIFSPRPRRKRAGLTSSLSYRSASPGSSASWSPSYAATPQRAGP